MTKTMAGVLEAHPEPVIEHGYWYCPCGHDYGVGPSTADVAAHQSVALSAAGFGLVADAKGEAWDECEAASYEIRITDDGKSWEPVKVNPYRAEASS